MLSQADLVWERILLQTRDLNPTGKDKGPWWERMALDMGPYIYMYVCIVGHLAPENV